MTLPPTRPVRAPTGGALLLAATLLLASPSQAARPERTPRGRVLHEPPPTGTSRGRSDRVVGRSPPEGGALPEAIETAAGRIDRPEVAAGGTDKAPLYEAPLPGMAGIPERVRPDRRTGGEGELSYQVVFDPSVTPFKRDRVFDQVAADGSLERSGRGRRPLLAQGDRTLPGRELFWGHVTLALVPGRETPLPSVAPRSRLLRFVATPPLPLRFFVDRAGNQSVSSTRAGTVTLRFLVDAPSGYFAAPLGPGPATDDPWRPALPAGLQRQMQALWPALDVHPTRRDRRHNLRALARWFRAFEAGALPPARQGVVSDLVVARKGVCRHRSLGFVVMAHSLGIPAQYVMNDAHAFVEVWAVGASGAGGWQRVDLGGSAETLHLHSARDKHLHRPLFSDPMPRPAPYARSAAVAAEGAGLAGESWAGARRVTGAGQMIDARVRARGEGGADARGKRGASASPKKGRAWMRRRAMAVAALRAPPPPDARRLPPRPAGDPRAPTSVILDRHAGLAYVGELLEVRGRVRVAGAPPGARLPLEVWLVDVRNPTRGVQVGSAVSRPEGTFAARVQVPLDAHLGTYDLVVRFPGDARRAPAFSLAR